MEKLNVAIADDNERIVELLDRIVSSDEELNVVGKAGNGEELYDIIKAKEVLGDYQIIEGGLKMASLRTDSPEKIKDDVKKIIDACQPGDGFLFCTDKAWIAPGDVNQNLIDAYNFAHEYSLSRTQK